MGVSLQQWRMALGGDPGTMLNYEASHPPGFYGLVVAMLLIAAGIEPNPGPTLKGNCELCGVLVEERTKGIEKREKALSEEEQSLKEQRQNIELAKKELVVKDKLLQKKIASIEESWSALKTREIQLLEREKLNNELEKVFMKTRGFSKMTEEESNSREPEPALTRDGLIDVIRNGKWWDVKKLLRTGKVSIEERFDNRATPILIASQHGQLSVVRFLFEEDSTCKFMADNNGKSALHWAVVGGHYHVVQYLVKEAGFDPSATTVSGDSPLHLAVELGHIEIVHFLVEDAKVDIHFQTSAGKNAIHIAAAQGYLHLVKYLWEMSAGVPIGVCKSGWTALHYACYNDRLDVLMYLVNVVGVDKKAKNREGKIPADYSRKEYIKQLLN